MRFSKRQRTKFLMYKYACTFPGSCAELAYRFQKTLEILLSFHTGN